MAQCQNFHLTGDIIINGSPHVLCSLFPKEGMQTQAGNIQITDLMIFNLSGSKEAANELVDFLIDKCPDRGLNRINFVGWKSSVTEVEPELLTLLT